MSRTVSASAGFGKITLLSEWIGQSETKVRVAWLSLAKGDNYYGSGGIAFAAKGGIQLIKPTFITWILVIFGALFIFLPMLYTQLLMALRPHSQKTKDLLIGKGEDWRDKTHFRMAWGAAWADLIVWLPLMPSLTATPGSTRKRGISPYLTTG